MQYFPPVDIISHILAQSFKLGTFGVSCLGNCQVEYAIYSNRRENYALFFCKDTCSWIVKNRGHIILIEFVALELNNFLMYMSNLMFDMISL